MNKLTMPILLVGLVALTGCNGNWNGDEWVAGADTARQSVLTSIPQAPYQGEQHAALKSYFETSENLIQLLDEEPKAPKKFNEYLAKKDINDVCSRVLVDVASWKAAMKNCLKNRYFLCAEAVRQYPDNFKKLRDALTTENRERFDQAEACRLEF